MDLQTVAQALAGTIDPQTRVQSEAYLEQVNKIQILRKESLDEFVFVGSSSSRFHHVFITNTHGFISQSGHETVWYGKIDKK